MSKPKDWTAGSVLVVLCSALVAAGAVWVMWTADPVLTLLAGCWAALTGLCVLAATRNLRAELDAARRLLDAWNSSEARDELAQSPPAGTPSVELYDQDAPPDPLACVYDATDPAQVDRVAAGAADCGCLDCWGWLKRNGYLATPPPGVPRMGADLAYPMTVAETDRLVAQLQALPGEDVIESTEIPRGQGLARLAEASAAQEAALAYIREHYGVPAYACGHVTVDGRQGIITGAQDGHLLVVFTGADEHPMPCHPTWRVVYDRSDWHLGQPCARCDAPATAWVSDRPDPEISDVTFLCDGCYAGRMSEEDGRG